MMRFFAVLLLFLMMSPVTAFAEEPISVIVNKANAVSSLSRGDLSRIYRGETTAWSNGMHVVIVNRSIGSGVRDTFYRRVLKVDPNTKFYIPDTMAPIRTVVQQSDEATKRFVANVAGAIGYIASDEVDESVKLLFVGGLSEIK